MKRTHAFVFGCLISGILVVAILFQLSNQMIHKRNSFIRQFPPHPLSPGDTLDVRFNSFYIAGSTKSQIYLGNFTAPLYVLRTSKKLTDTVSARVNALDLGDLMGSYRLNVDSPFFYLVDGTKPVIYKGDIETWAAYKDLTNDPYFVDLIPISQKSHFIRSVSSATTDYVLGKISLNEKERTRLFPHLLEKQVDGRFCVDGMMHFDKKHNFLLYLYYYRNEFFLMDTSMNVIFKGHTIDTTSRAKIETHTLSSTGSRTLAAPPLLVNKKSSVAGNRLFVISNLLAKNENRKTFNASTVIDIYELNDGSYMFSLYIPDYRGFKIRDFKVIDDKMYTFFDHFILSYHLEARFFSN